MDKIKKRITRKARIKAKIRGTVTRPRLTVFRSNKFVYAQLVNDEKGETIMGFSEKHVEKIAGKKTDKSKALGLLIAKSAIAKKIKKIVFDRSGYAYHGRVKAIADGAREGGLEF